jgi:predicted dehydrogenase
MGRRSSRREFLRQGAAAGLGFWTLGGLSLAIEPKGSNDEIQFACIGVAGKGGGDSSHAGMFGKVVAICDIDEERLNAKGKEFKEAQKFTDFRELLDKMGDKVDAVTVSTPDHTHAVAAIRAMKLKKHVYCQKPLTWSVQEARLMRKIAKENGVATQMGNQGTAHDGLRRAIEVIQSGAIGDTKEVHVWTNRPVWPQAPEVTKRLDETECPKHIHWNEWLGPAPERPYVGTMMKNKHPTYHEFNWRGWRDFGTGALGDMACHTANMAFLSLELGLPTSVKAENAEVNPETFQQWATIVYKFAARGKLPPVTLTWWEGTKDDKQNLPAKDLFQGEKIVSSGSLFIGEKGTLYSPDDYGAAITLLPKDTFKDYKDPEKKLYRWGGKNDVDVYQKEEWVRAIRGGDAAMSNFQYASTITETMILGNVAIVAGKELQYDGAEGKITNDTELNKLLSRTPRKGWES